MTRSHRPCFDHDGTPLLTASEAARRLGVNTETVRRWVRKGAIAVVEIGPHRRKKLRQDDVDRQRSYSGAA